MVASLGMILNTLFYMVTIQKIRREQLEFQEYLKTLNEIENGDSMTDEKKRTPCAGNTQDSGHHSTDFRGCFYNVQDDKGGWQLYE